MPETSDAFEGVNNRLDLDAAMWRYLTPQEHGVLLMMREGFTQERTARALGVTQQRVCYLRNRAVARLRRQMEK